MPWLETSAPFPLPEYLLAAIEASWETRTYRTDLELSMGAAHAEMSQAGNMLIEEYSRDTVSDPLDSLRMVWQQIRTPGARYAEALVLLQLGEYTAAYNLVQAIPLEHPELKPPDWEEKERMLALITFKQTIAASGRGDDELTVAEQDQLALLAGEATDRPAVWAQNLLCFYYDRCVAPPSGGEDEGPKARDIAESQSTPSQPLMSIHPNPTNSWAAVNLSLPATQALVTLRVLDLAGKMVQQHIVKPQQPQVVLDTRPLKPGAYFVELYSEAKTLATEKLIVQP